MACTVVATQNWHFSGLSNVRMAEVTCEGDRKEYLHTVVAHMGYGAGTFIDGSVTQNAGGSPFSVHLTCKGISSDSVKLTTKCQASGGSYTGSTFQTVTFSFGDRLQIGAGQTNTLRIIIESDDTSCTMVRNYTMDCTSEVVNPAKFKVNFHPNHGNGEIFSVEGYAGDSIFLPAPTYDGPTIKIIYNDLNGQATIDPDIEYSILIRNFSHWNTSVDDTGRKLNVGDSYTPPQGASPLYAQWSVAKVPKLPTASKVGKFTFKGWVRKIDGNNISVKEGDTIPTTTTQMTLFPTFDFEDVTLTFNASNSVYKGLIDNMDRADEEGYINPSETKTKHLVKGREAIHIPNRDRYYTYIVTGTDTPTTEEVQEPDDIWYFYGWGWDTSNNIATRVYTGNPDANEWCPVDDIQDPSHGPVLYAIYAEKTFVVKFVDGYRAEDKGGLIATHTGVKFGSSVEPPPDPVRKGSEFLGWSTDEYLNVRKNLTVKALWSRTPIWIMTADKGWIKYEPTKKQ